VHRDRKKAQKRFAKSAICGSDASSSYKGTDFLFEGWNLNSFTQSEWRQLRQYCTGGLDKRARETCLEISKIKHKNFGWNSKDMYHPHATAWHYTLARSGRILDIFQLFIFGSPQSLLSMIRRSSAEWDAFGQSDLRPCYNIRFLTQNLRCCKSRPWLVSWDIDGFWRYRNLQDLMPRSLSQLRRTQHDNSLCWIWGSPSHMTWCIMDVVTTSHTISDNAVFEEICRNRADDTDENHVRIRKNNWKMNCSHTFNACEKALP